MSDRTALEDAGPTTPALEETEPDESGLDESAQSPGALRRQVEALRHKVRELEARDRERRDLLERTEYALRFNQFAMDSVTDALYWVKEDARIAYVNHAACAMLGYDEDELLAMQVYDLDPGQNPEIWPKIWQLLKHERRRTMETRHRAKNGEIIPVEVAGNFFEFGGEEYSIAFVRDIRDRKRLEYRLRQEEKMAAIGQLAGGIAHDFNNQLMGILGYADILREQVAHNPEQEKLANGILHAVNRSADLTNQLLAFSRRGKYVTEPVDLHSVVNEVTDILAHSIDKKIVIDCTLSAEISIVLGDSSQLQNAILNLALNARDAMPNGGRLSFGTRRSLLDGSFVGNPPFEVAAGEYVCLSVSDTGGGIPAEIQHRVFEPFFTTKPSAQGTGLGLSAVYGTVKNHRGAINLSSRPGAGTCIELYLPASDSKVVPAADDANEAALPGKSRRVVVVEDEAVLRDVACRMLAALGYQVETFASGPQALRYYEKQAENVDLVILDMVMPVMSGKEIFAAMKRINPEVKVVLASGYSLDGDTQAVMDDGVRGFLQKPYRRDTLADLLRRVLDEPTKAT